MTELQVAGLVRVRAEIHESLSVAEEHVALAWVRDHHPYAFDDATRHVGVMRDSDRRRRGTGS